MDLVIVRRVNGNAHIYGHQNRYPEVCGCEKTISDKIKPKKCATGADQ